MGKLLIETEIIRDLVHPYDVEAWDIFGRENIINCHRNLFLKYGGAWGGEMNSWDCYDAFCQDCDEHDKCFKSSDWFTDLINE